jgi:hypothetical protein
MRLMHATSIGARLYLEQSTAISERSAAADEDTGKSPVRIGGNALSSLDQLQLPNGPRCGWQRRGGLREAGMYIAATGLLK